MKKENLQTILFLGTMFLVLFIITKGLQALDEETKRSAILRCGGEDKIVARYTKEGDIYYTCSE